jgi:hypothetical protein
VLYLRAGIANALKRNADIAQALKMAGTAAKLAVQRVAPVNHGKAPGNTGNSGDAEGGDECSVSHAWKRMRWVCFLLVFSSIATALKQYSVYCPTSHFIAFT